MVRTNKRGRVSKAQTGGSKGGRRKGGLALKLVIVAVVLVGAVVLGKHIMDVVNTNIANANILANQKCYDGVFIDDIAMGGLTRDQARQQIEAKQQQYLQTLVLTVADANGAMTQLPVSDLPEQAYGFDTEAILEQAWKLGRDGATDEDNLAYIAQLPDNPVTLTTTLLSVDPSSLEQKVRDLAAPFYEAPQDATFDPTAYDPTKEVNERLSFTAEVPGHQADADKLWQQVRDGFVNMTFGTVTMTLVDIQPAVTQADLQANLQLVAISPISTGSSSENKKLNEANVGHTFTTQIRDHSNERLTNIRLANEAVSGIVMPGEIFSMNQRTGDRTAQQGYQIAPIDKSGVVDRGLGGGVCQVSGTLYNAAIRYGGKYEVDSAPASDGVVQPGLAITVRDTHSLPSSYLHTGTDATVDIGSGKDLQFRNDFDQPVLIYMYYDKNEKGEYFEHCDIYGPPLADGATYDLIRKNVKTLPADTTTPPKTVYSKYATPGSPLYIEPRSGYSVDVYIEKNVNGEKTQVKAYTNSYKAQPAYYYVYTGETAPTPTPLPTDTPIPETPTPPPTEAPPQDPTQAPETPTLGPTDTPAAG